MSRTILLSVILLSVAGCGLGETAVSAGAGGATRAQKLEQARQTQERIGQRLEEAARQAAERRQAIDAKE